MLLFILAGFIYLTAVSLKKRAFQPPAVFCLFPLPFFLLYIFSSFGTKSAVRYFYPLYISLPVLFPAVFLALKSRIRHFMPYALVALLFIPNIKMSFSHYASIKNDHLRIGRAAGAMADTGRRYWCGDYWTAYLLTAITGEKLVVSAVYYDRYPAYTSAYYTQTDKDSFVYLVKDRPSEEARYSKMVRWLETFDIPATRATVDDCRLLYDVDSRFYPGWQFRDIPPQYPHLEMADMQTSGGYLHLVFKNQTVGEDVRFRLRVEIPGFSSRILSISLADAEIKTEIPYPQRAFFSVHYALDFTGTRIPATDREVVFSPPKDDGGERHDPLVNLSGFGPEVLIARQPAFVCEREISFEINRRISGPITVRMFLYPAFQPLDWRWYGRSPQRVSIILNDTYSTQRELRYGRNAVRLWIPKKYLKDHGNTLTLRFEYRTWLPMALAWQIGAFLDKIELF